jgi:hypothetical protein
MDLVARTRTCKALEQVGPLRRTYRAPDQEADKATTMSNVEAYRDGYDAYLRRYDRSSDHGERPPVSDEEPRSPYVDDSALFGAWLEGWQNGRCHATSDLREAISGLSGPSPIPAMGAVWPMPIRAASALRWHL